VLEGCPRLRVFLWIGRFDPNRGEVVLIGLVARFLCQGCGEMAFLACFIALRTRQPSGNDMVRRAFAILLRHALERFAGCIELTEAQSGRGQVELAINVARSQARDFRAPDHGFGAILFLGCFGQNLIGRQRIMIDL
jgi:hypothetical protein